MLTEVIKLIYTELVLECNVFCVWMFLLGLNEQRVSDFQVSPDGKYLLLSGSSGYLHLMTTKVQHSDPIKSARDVCSHSEYFLKINSPAAAINVLFSLLSFIYLVLKG